MTPRRTLAPVLLLVLALAVGATGCGQSDGAVDQSPAGSSADPSSSTSAETDEAADPTTRPEESGTVTVPVYFVGDTPQGPRLYREFRTVEDDNPLEEAVALMTAGDADDPDYRTAYPGGSFSSVSFDGDRFVVEVPDDGWMAPGDLSEDEATLALQQLVYTVQGVQQERAPVEVVLDGQATFLFGEDTEGGVSNSDPLDVLALVNITTPEEGAPVSGSFTASGVASSFEATVPWQILTGSGDVVLEGFATAEGWMDKLYPWETEIDVSSLDPGLYTFVARTDDPSGGEGGGPTEDTKVIDVS